MRESPGRRRWLVALGVVAAAAGCISAAAAARSRASGLTEDERDYLRAATHLARRGVLSFDALDSPAAQPGAYREPAYAALLSLTWRATGAPLPTAAAESDAQLAAPRWRRAAWGLNLALLALAATSAGVAVRWVAGTPAGALAAAIVAASPALHERVGLLMSENLAAAHLAAVAAALVAWWRGVRGGATASLLLLALLPLSRSEGILLLPLGAAVAMARARERGRGRVARETVLVALLVVTPALLWTVRNRMVVGHLVLADRTGLALAVRAAIDRDVARNGALAPALAWTPGDAARERARSLPGGAGFLDYDWGGERNYFTRTVRAWRAERSRPGADPLAVDAAWRRDSLRYVATHPLAHLRAVPAVAWRGVFAERSPEWVRPFDLRLPIGLLLLLAICAVTVSALRRSDGAALLLVLPAWVLFGFHALATELLPRYAVPLLPIAWSAVALLLGRSGLRRPNA